jgi:hypothetical protein
VLPRVSLCLCRLTVCWSKVVTCDGIADRRNPIHFCGLGLHADYFHAPTASDDYSCPPAGVGSLDRSAGDPRGLGNFANNGLFGAGLYDLYLPTER